MRQRIAQNGFSLIELLVTVVIFSVGLLGVAGLQIVSKEAIFEAMQRTTATQIASGLLENMRANGPALATYVATGQIGQGTINGTTAPQCYDISNPCSASLIASRDLYHWETMMDGGGEASGGNGVGGLVLPATCITGPANGSSGVYVVSVVWRGTVKSADPGINACGANSGQYGAGNVYRRVIEMPTFIDPNI